MREYFVGETRQSEHHVGVTASRNISQPSPCLTMSKTAQSGLRTIKRDFSDTVLSALSQEVYWPPTPQPQPSKLTGSEQRLKAIQDALSEKSAPSQRSNALVESRATNKRPSPEISAAPATKKSRQLPPSWCEKDPLSAPSLSSKSSSSTVSRRTIAPGSTYTPPASSPPTLPTTKSKLSAVFLSQEQTQILRLVEAGQSVFYTGSAGQSIHAYSTLSSNLTIFLYLKGTGKSVLLREVIKTLRRKHVKSADAVAITASTGS